MNKGALIGIIVFILLLLGGGFLFLTGNKEKKQNDTTDVTKDTTIPSLNPSDIGLEMMEWIFAINNYSLVLKTSSDFPNYKTIEYLIETLYFI